MIVSGMFLKANMMRIVTLEGNRESHLQIAKGVNKLELPKHPVQTDVAMFIQAFRAYCNDSSVDKIVLNRRATFGQGAGGCGTFLIEGIILAVSDLPVGFAHFATIRATDKKKGNLKVAKPSTVDLGKAYDYAFEGLE